MSGWDPYAGTFSTNEAGSLSLQPRAAASLVPGQLYVNNTLVYWQGGLDTGGNITDTYADSGGQLSMVISGQVRDFQLGTSGASATVSINGTQVGTCAVGGVFNVSGWVVEAFAPNRNTPFFISGGRLWVDGSPYDFICGFEDSAGNCTDLYGTSDGTLSIAGNTANAAAGTVQVNHSGSIYSGSVTLGAGGSFVVPGLSIGAIAPDSGPPAFWVGGVFYKLVAGTNTYAPFPTSNSGDTLSLGGTDAASMVVSGTQGGVVFTGIFNPAAGGVFTLTTQGCGLLPVCPARTNGKWKHAGTAPQDYPPAVRALGTIWSFLGTTEEDGAAVGTTAAYYGNTRTAVFSTDPGAADPVLIQDYHPRLLKIRVAEAADVTVTLTDYTSATSQTGTYQPATLLFQTESAADGDLPMPFIGVDSCHGDTIWMLHPDATLGLPDTFIVRGQPWRFAGMQVTGANARAVYQGFYPNQQMQLNPTSGLVTLTDRPHNGLDLQNQDITTAGTLNRERGSVQLRDGTQVFSGNDQGSSVAVQAQDNFKLQTIAADLDIVGNNISFGIMQGDASLAGALFQFQDATLNGSLEPVINFCRIERRA